MKKGALQLKAVSMRMTRRSCRWRHRSWYCSEVRKTISAAPSSKQPVGGSFSSSSCARQVRGKDHGGSRPESLSTSMAMSIARKRMQTFVQVTTRLPMPQTARRAWLYRCSAGGGSWSSKSMTIWKPAANAASSEKTDMRSTSWSVYRRFF